MKNNQTRCYITYGRTVLEEFSLTELARYVDEIAGVRRNIEAVHAEAAEVLQRRNVARPLRILADLTEGEKHALRELLREEAERGPLRSYFDCQGEADRREGNG